MDIQQPRHGRGNDEPGKYELVGRVSSTTVNPGDTVSVILYITGYGKITSSKLFFSPPPITIFDEANSFIKAGIVAITPDGNKLSPGPGNREAVSNQQPIAGFGWGQEKININSGGFIISIRLVMV